MAPGGEAQLRSLGTVIVVLFNWVWFLRSEIQATESWQNICYWEMQAVIEATLQSKLMKCGQLGELDLFKWTAGCQETQLSSYALGCSPRWSWGKLCSTSHTKRQIALNAFIVQFENVEAKGASVWKIFIFKVVLQNMLRWDIRNNIQKCSPQWQSLYLKAVCTFYELHYKVCANTDIKR